RPAATSTRSRSVPSRSSPRRATAGRSSSSGPRAVWAKTGPGTARVDGREELQVKLKVWGARGSVPAPGPEMNRYGGNTSCCQLTLSDGTELILDAGTGIRSLGIALAADLPKVNILLTHLQLDHIQGLLVLPACLLLYAEI